MGKSQNAGDGSGQTGETLSGSTARVLVATMADTTWRMFVPTAGFTLLGVWADASWHTKPYLMFAGIALGVICAVVLVKRQLGRVETGAPRE
jgi:hypothetical protein